MNMSWLMAALSQKANFQIFFSPRAKIQIHHAVIKPARQALFKKQTTRPQTLSHAPRFLKPTTIFNPRQILSHNQKNKF